MRSLKNYTELLAQKEICLSFIIGTGNDRNVFIGNCLSNLWSNYLHPIKGIILAAHLIAWEMLLSHVIEM